RGVAPSFRGFLYRMLLEEFSGSWIVDNPEDEEGKARIRRAVEVICPQLPREWAQRIDELSRQPGDTDNDEGVCVCPRNGVKRIIEKDLAFLNLDVVFQQELETVSGG